MSSDHSSPTAVVELRQYTLHPGRRDDLIELFDREFVETQEAVGMRVLGQFRDLDDPDRFVWLRGFADMTSRRLGLGAFYGGPVWAAHRDAANATMIDSDDVLLLRPLGPTIASGAGRSDDGIVPESQVMLAVLSLDSAGDRDQADALRSATESVAADGIETVAVFETETSENTFPALPVRTGEHVVVWVTRFDDACRLDAAMSTLTAVVGSLRATSVRYLRLQPTSRSAIR